MPKHIDLSTLPTHALALSGNLLDITAPKHGVDVSVSDDRTMLWVNVDGICVLRVCRIPSLQINAPKPGSSSAKRKSKAR